MNDERQIDVGEHVVFMRPFGYDLVIGDRCNLRWMRAPCSAIIVEVGDFGDGAYASVRFVMSDGQIGRVLVNARFFDDPKNVMRLGR